MRERVIEIVGNVLGVDASELTDASSPDSIEVWDSLKHMNLVLALEEEFGVQFDDEQIMAMLSIAKIVSTIESASGSG